MTRRLDAVLTALSFLLLVRDLGANPCGKRPGDPPGAVEDVVFIQTVGQVIHIPVLANDAVRPDGQLQIVPGAFTQGTYGTVELNLSDSSLLTYRHTASTLARDEFLYTIRDATLPEGPIAEGRVVIEPPVAARTMSIAYRPKCATKTSDDCVGGNQYLFEATLSDTAGLKSITWTFAPGYSYVGGLRESYVYTTAATHTVRARADYFSGESVESSVQVTVTLSNELDWTVSSDGLRASATVSRESLNNFNGGPWGGTLRVRMGDFAEECAFNDQGVTCGRFSRYTCTNYCETAHATFIRPGTYPVYAEVTDSFDRTFNFAKYVTVTNKPPQANFTFRRPYPWRRYVEFDPSGTTDEIPEGPFAPSFEWDSGEGAPTKLKSDASVYEHDYRALGKYTVSLRATDSAGDSGYVSKEVELTNNPPLPMVALNCRGVLCDFSAANTLDDGAVRYWTWSFSSDSLVSGQAGNTHSRTMPWGCHSVTVGAHDDLGASGSRTHTFAAGIYDLRSFNARFWKPIGVSVDTHTMTYKRWHDLYETELNTTGNLNGILEPGERVVVEPTWTVPASGATHLGTTEPVSIRSTNGAVTGSVQDKSAQYDVSLGFSDCWAKGNCYVLDAKANGPRTTPHADLILTERTVDDDTGASTDRPIVVHVGNSFADVPPSTWYYGLVESSLHAGITTGCGNGNYCAADPINRGPMARWVLRAKYGTSYVPPPCTTPPFNDVPCSDPDAPWIAQFKAEGITAGTGGNNYSPTLVTTRWEMAVFILRAIEGGAYVPPACTTAPYDDVPCSSFASPWIAELKNRGMATECAANQFCPAQSVIRLDGANLLMLAFNLYIDRRICGAGVPIHISNPPAGSYTP